MKKRLNKNSRKKMKGGFWPFTSSQPVDPNQPAPVKRTWSNFLFGSKKTEPATGTEPTAPPTATGTEPPTEPTTAPPTAPTEPTTSTDTAPMMGNADYRGAGGKTAKKGKKKEEKKKRKRRSCKKN